MNSVLARCIAWRRKYLGRDRISAHAFAVRNRLLGDAPIAIELLGRSIRLRPEGAVPFIAWYQGGFERCELEFFVRALLPGQVVLDIGANVGIYSLAAALHVPAAHVFAFEPCRETYNRLLLNLGLNCVKNVSPSCLALSDFEGEARLSVNVTGRDGLNTLGTPTHPECVVVGSETVRVGTLDNWLRARAIGRVHLLKIDVEGAELHVFRGAGSLLAGADAPLIMFENGTCTAGFGHTPDDVFSCLKHHGYQIATIHPISGRLAPHRAGDCNGMFVGIKPSHPSYDTWLGPN